MMGLKTLLLSALAATGSATQLFRNTGTRSGWDRIQTEWQGRVDEITNNPYEGSTALKFQQTYDTTGVYKGRYHSEVHKFNAYSHGDMRFYGFAFRLHSTWDLDSQQNFDIAQFIADFSGVSSCDGYMPTTMVWLRGRRLWTRTKSGTVCSQRTQSYNTGVDVTAGVWHKIVMQVRWSPNNDGQFKLWYDGNKVVEHYNIPTTVSENVPFQFRVGLYANGWYDDKGIVGSQVNRQMWVDEIAYGTTFADADPAQW